MIFLKIKVLHAPSKIDVFSPTSMYRNLYNIMERCPCPDCSHIIQEPDGDISTKLFSDDSLPLGGGFRTFFIS